MSRHLLVPDTQVCTKCLAAKPIGAFGVRHDRGQPYRQCRDCMAARKWYQRNPDRQRELNQSWRDRNPERMRAIWREMAARRRQSPAYRIHGRISNQLWATLRELKNCRRAFDLLGYGVDELRAHLERQFVKGMGWHNMAEWHIDHIMPLSSFTITGPDDPELRRAWALANLRPLWAADNMRKGARIETLI